MSRIGKLPIAIPAGVEVTVDGSTVTVKGPKGTLSQTFSSKMTIEKEGDTIKVTRPNDEKENRSLHGLTRTLIANMVAGVTEGFKKTLDVNGVGYRVAKENGKLVWGGISAVTNTILAGAGIVITDNGGGAITISAEPLSEESEDTE